MQRLLAFILLFWSINLNGQTTTFFPAGGNWKYNDTGVDLGIQWYSSSYNDNLWSTGNAELGYGDGDEQTTVSYGSNASNKQATTYFRKSFFVANPSTFSQITGSIKRDDGAVVYVNGVEVFRSNMPAGMIAYQTLSAGTVAWPNEDNWYNFEFSPALLQAGNNVIAVEIHQDELSSSDISFDCSLAGNQSPVNSAVMRGPYLQSATTNSVIIRWRTDVPTDSKVRFGSNLANLNQSALGYPFTTEHEVLITGLQPATTYYYTIGNSGQALTLPDNAIYFKTSPVEGTAEKFRFWVIGDAGMGNTDQRDVRDGFLMRNQGQHLDGWIMLGDNAYGSGINDGTQQNYQDGVFENMYETTLQNTVLWPSVGNHEYNNHIPFSPDPAYFDIFTLPVYGEAGGIPSGTEKYYSYNYGNIHFIVLDSYDVDRGSNGAMANWLIADLQQNTAEWTIAYWHHPPYTKGSHDSDNGLFLDGELVEMRENILPIIEQYGVDLVLNGHSHSYERSFLIDGHYGYSNELIPSMILDNGFGGSNGDCPYEKNTTISKAHKGTIYAVVGCSGKLSGTSSGWPHPAMAYSIETRLGSMIMTVDHNRLDAEFVGIDGSITDYFSILKNSGVRDTVVTCPNEALTLTPSFPGTANWFPLGINADSITINPAFSTMYIATDSSGCLIDTIFVEVVNSPDCNLSLIDSKGQKPSLLVQQVNNDSPISLIWNGFTGSEVTMTLYSIYGQLIDQQQLVNNPTKNVWTSSMTNMAQGTYFIRMSDTQHQLIIQFIRN